MLAISWYLGFLKGQWRAVGRGSGFSSVFVRSVPGWGKHGDRPYGLTSIAKGSKCRHGTYNQTPRS